MDSLPPWLLAAADVVTASLSESYIAIFGDTPLPYFYYHLVPLLYVSLLPIFNVVVLMLSSACEVGAIAAQRRTPAAIC